ncbi:MAG: hypothetical protein KGJ92_09200 [Actinomycetales bacterium]|nr:hypothetical protein [Actinomycetales bacterium]
MDLTIGLTGLIGQVASVGHRGKVDAAMGEPPASADSGNASAAPASIAARICRQRVDLTSESAPIMTPPR